MSDYKPSLVPLQAGLDLQSPKLLATPGSLLDCLNYEIVSHMGYKRVDGFQRYDGHTTIKDIPNYKVYYGRVMGSGPVTPIVNEPFEDSFGNVVGMIFSSAEEPGGFDAITFVSFSGTIVPGGTTTTTAWSFQVDVDHVREYTQTQAQMIALESYLRSTVTSLDETPVGLHWYNDKLWAVVPMVMVPYQVSVDNVTADYTINDIINSSTGASGRLLEKIVTRVASVSQSERGYIVMETMSGNWTAATINTSTLSGGISSLSGVVYHQPGNLSGMNSDVCSIWYAQRSPIFSSISKLYSDSGWFNVGVLNTYTMTVEQSNPITTLPSIRTNSSTSEATYYFSDGTDTYPAVLVDYKIISGTLQDGNAEMVMQFSVPNGDITPAFTLYTDVGLTDDIAEVTVRMSYNYLPGLPSLTNNISRYEFRTANFYASDDMTQMYGVNGAGRAFSFDGTYLSFIRTQEDSNLDKPRHLENHHLHLALGFSAGSVQLSVAGQPTNFDGVMGASDIGVGDRVTGLMEVEGTTLMVFCEQSIWSIVGTSVDNFQTQVVAPNTGCIEYSLANCGQPVYLDNRGVSTLQTSARYGDFVGTRLSSPVNPWLVPKCRTSLLAINNSSGIACALPIRNKNQYRLFFNDGEILTMTFMTGDDSEVGFTFQRYYLEQDVITETLKRLVPICATSEMDRYGVERIYVAHYNADSPVVSKHVYSLDSGESFDGNYIPHYFDTNWYFGDTPVIHSTLSGVRLYGLSRGLANINVSLVGQQSDFDFSGATLTTTPTDVNLPSPISAIVNEYVPVTTRTDISGRGISIRFRFSGSNTDLALAEPSHVCQVLITYTSQEGAFDL